MSKLDKSKIRKYWDNNIYDNYLRSGAPFTLEELSILRHKIETKRFFKNVPLRKSCNFLELGCGSGRYAIDIAPLVKKVVAVDFSKKQIMQLEKIILKRGIKNIITRCEDVTEAKFKDKFDIIFLSGVTQYIDDEELMNLLKYLRMCLNSNGIIVSRDSLNLFNTVYIGGVYPSKYRSKKDFLDIFQKAGFENIKFFTAYSFIADGMAKKLVPKSVRKVILNERIYLFIESCLIKIDKQLSYLMKVVKKINVDAEHVFSMWKLYEE